MAEVAIIPDQEAEAQRLADRAMIRARGELLDIFRLLLAKPDHQLLGQTEFEIRERILKIGAEVYEAALEERKKGGTKGPA